MRYSGTDSPILSVIMECSYFIKRNLKFLNNNGYTLYPNGNQVYKRIGDYDVLITDYTGKKLSLDLLIIFELWIKNNITDVLIFRKMYKRTFFCPESTYKKCLREE